MFMFLSVWTYAAASQYLCNTTYVRRSMTDTIEGQTIAVTIGHYLVKFSVYGLTLTLVA